MHENLSFPKEEREPPVETVADFCRCGRANGSFEIRVVVGGAPDITLQWPSVKCLARNANRDIVLIIGIVIAITGRFLRPQSRDRRSPGFATVSIDDDALADTNRRLSPCRAFKQSRNEINTTNYTL